jgi:NADPH:quinone reductase-like Zn-dependent oxidoreductase
MDTMMALRAHARGGPEQLVYEQAPRPVAGPAEALVAVHAAGITFDELTWDESWTTRDGADRTPVIPAHEVSGTVLATGPGVTDPAPGDEVYALIDFDRDGAAAEYVTVPVSALARRPRSVSHVQAATLPLAALTAWQALVDHAGLARGERVLVQGGAGGVGAYAVQLAAILGGQVTATGRSHSEAFVRDLGARDFISSGAPDGAGAQAGAAAAASQDVVIDTVGGQVLADSFALLRRGGRLITLGAPPDPELAARYGVDARFFVVRPDRGELAQLAGLTDEGRLRPVVSQVFPLADGRRAYASRGQDRPPGKTVLAIR